MTAQGATVDAAFWAGRRVLVTGHTGFKGAWLCTWLTSLGADVTGFSDAVPTSPSLFDLAGVGAVVRDVRGDVGDVDAVTAAMVQTRPEVVLHLAAQSLVRSSYRTPVRTFRSNVMGTVHVLDAVRASGDVEVALVVTSDKCYENQGWPWGYREADHLGGHDPYSSSKAAAELVTAAYRASFLGSQGTRVATARAGNVVGGGDWSEDRLLPDVMRAALAGQPVFVRNPAAVRPWQHVLDCLSGYLVLVQALWERSDLQGAWNFGPSQEDERTVRDVVAMITARWPEPLDVRTDTGAHPHEAPRLTLDTAKAREVLGWRPRWTADQAADRAVEWYLGFRSGADMSALTRRQIIEHQAVRR